MRPSDQSSPGPGWWKNQWGGWQPPVTEADLAAMPEIPSGTKTVAVGLPAMLKFLQERGQAEAAPLEYGVVAGSQAALLRGKQGKRRTIGRK